MDSIDLFIVETLVKDARTSFRQIAAALDVSPDTIIDRYNALLEKGTVRGSTIVLNPRKIGYSAMAVFMIDVSPTEKEAETPIDSSLVLETLIKIKEETGHDKDLAALPILRRTLQERSKN